jgi:hypothetical protein
MELVNLLKVRLPLQSHLSPSDLHQFSFLTFTLFFFIYAYCRRNVGNRLNEDRRIFPLFHLSSITNLNVSIPAILSSIRVGGSNPGLLLY